MRTRFSSKLSLVEALSHLTPADPLFREAMDVVARELYAIARSQEGGWVARASREDAAGDLLKRWLRTGVKFDGQTERQAFGLLVAALENQMASLARGGKNRAYRDITEHKYDRRASFKPGEDVAPQLSALERHEAGALRDAAIARLLDGSAAARPCDAPHVARRARRALHMIGLRPTTEVFPSGQNSAEAKAESRAIKRVIRHLATAKSPRDRAVHRIATWMSDLRGFKTGSAT